MKHYCINDLKSIRELIEQLSVNEYTNLLTILSGATIGQHVRHILEFYTCLFEGIPTGMVNYDKRKRDLLIETDIDYATATIDSIFEKLVKPEDINNSIILKGNFDTDTTAVQTIHSSVYRELTYCLEHSIHHQALIKVGLKEMNLTKLIPGHFGIAPSTIRNNQSLKLRTQ